MAPVIRAFRQANWADTTVLSTGQHRDILNQTLSDFDLSTDLDLGLMEPSQTLAGLTSKLFAALDPAVGGLAPTMVLAQGDTTSVMVASVVCFYRGIPFGHVEAGLRTFDLRQPFPEEFNRLVTAKVTAAHFAPTEISGNNLRREGICEDSIFVTGNTVIDALLDMSERIGGPEQASSERPMILITAHRRENFGEPLLRICDGIRRIHDRFEQVDFVYPVHPNPQIRNVVAKELGGLARMSLIPPVGYRELVGLLRRSKIVLTDSGGIQEEAPALAKPVLVLRETTERPEAVEEGVVKLVGTDPDLILSEVTRLMTDPSYYRSIARGVSPYGDGKASGRIVDICARITRDL